MTQKTTQGATKSIIFASEIMAVAFSVETNLALETVKN